MTGTFLYIYCEENNFGGFDSVKNQTPGGLAEAATVLT
jgi:hypothetical protein